MAGDVMPVSLFVCPLCRKPLMRRTGCYVCPSGHNFDIAAAGYVHLLPVQQKHSSLPGDGKEMAAARNRFLNGGWYAPLRDTMIKTVSGRFPENGTLLDSGCGEGYYTAGLCRALTETGKRPAVCGIDISKFSLRLAAKRDRRIEFAVASAYHMPLADQSVDFLVNCFSPLALDEFQRVIRPGGYFLYVVPAPRHLWELKAAIYDKPYENQEKMTPYAGFSYCSVNRVRERVMLSDAQTIRDLFNMTPYLWKTPKSGLERMNALKSLEVETSFDLHLFRRD